MVGKIRGGAAKSKLELKLITVINCGGSSILDEPRTTSLFNLVVSLWQTLSWGSINFMSTNNPERQLSKLYKMHKKFHTSDLVAPQWWIQKSVGPSSKNH